MKKIILIFMISIMSIAFIGCSFPLLGSSDKNDSKAKSTVLEVEVIELNYYKTTINEEQTITLEATIIPTNATKNKLSWTSSDNSVAVVNGKGEVTGVSYGVADIICKAESGVKATCTVTVKAKTNYVYGHLNPSYNYVETDFVFPDSSTKYLTDSEITDKLSSMYGATVSGSFAQDAINEIYARNGYIFSEAPAIQRYYQNQAWYYPDPTFTIDDFNQYEKYNVDLLATYR